MTSEGGSLSGEANGGRLGVIGRAERGMAEARGGGGVGRGMGGSPRDFRISRTIVVKAVSTPASVFAETSIQGHLNLLLASQRKWEKGGS